MNINSIKRYVGNSIKGMAQSYQAGMDAKKKKIETELQSMGYRDINHFYEKHPETKDIPTEDLFSKGVRKVVSGLRGLVSRYKK